MRKRPACLAIYLCFACMVAVAAFAAPDGKVVIEQSTASPCPMSSSGGTLGTTSYKPTKKESPFYQNLSPEERKTGSLFEDYSITGKVGSYVGWFGIVRGIETDTTRNESRLLVEMKYFDGLTDTHSQVVSFKGGGDFTVVLPGATSKLKELSLVKVYGKVESERDSVPEVRGEFVRYWDWGAFTFMSYGDQKGNAKWKDLARIGERRIYQACPSEQYYVDRLGPRK